MKAIKNDEFDLPQIRFFERESSLVCKKDYAFPKSIVMEERK